MEKKYFILPENLSVYSEIEMVSWRTTEFNSKELAIAEAQKTALANKDNFLVCSVEAVVTYGVCVTSTN